MTSGQQPTEDKAQFAPDTAPDGLLDAFINLANGEMGFTMGITLNVHGTIVSGLLVGYKQYVEGMTDTIKSAGDIGQVLGETLRERLLELGEPNEQNGESLPPRYIHLKDARFFYPGGALPGGQGVWWRGLLSAVDGFNIGSLGTDS